MSLIDNGQNQNQGPIELTVAQKQNRVKMQIERKIWEAFAGLVGIHNDLKNGVWNNPQELTPQEVFDALGTNSGELFALSTLLVNTVNAAKPGTLVDEHPYNYTINPDGTVTVGDPV